MNRKIKKYGWQPDLPDIRDLQYTPKETTLQSVSLLGKYNMPPIYDQGDLGSCTANGIARLMEFYLMNKNANENPKASLYMPSRLFIYYYERAIEGDINADNGAQIRDGIKVVYSKGVCDENIIPYDITKFAVAPSSHALQEALKFKATEYKSVDNTNVMNIVSALQEGHPVVFGFTVYESFESNSVAVTGIVPMPGANESVLGGHCCVIIGYDADAKMFKCANSWGTDWGVNGYFTIPEAYLTNSNLASDFWIIMQTEF
jgi:C1A family cysteine protease